MINCYVYHYDQGTFVVVNTKCIGQWNMHRIIDIVLDLSLNTEASQCQYVSLGVDLELTTYIQLEKYYNKCVQL